MGILLGILFSVAFWGALIYVLVKGVKAIFGNSESSKISALARIIDQKGVITKDDFTVVVGSITSSKAPAPVKPASAYENISNALYASVPGQLSSTPSPASVGSAAVDQAEHDFTAGGKWLTLVGVLAIIFGVGFFIKYSFDNNLINEAGRVILGAVFGLAFILAGDFLYKKYASYASFLTGGGLGILYLSFYGAYGIYGVISQKTGLLLLIITTCIAVAMAVRYDKIWVAGVSVLGGFITPLLLGMQNTDTYLLLNYVLVLDLGLIGLAYYRKWSAIMLGSFVGTFLYLQWWFAFVYNANILWNTEVYVTIFWAIFLVATLLFYYSSTRAERFTGGEAMLMVFNALSYLGASYFMLHPLYGKLVGFILAIVYIIIAWVGSTVRSENKALFIIPAGLAVLSLSLVFPIIFDSKTWIVASWFVEASVVAWMGAYLRSNIFYFIIPLIAWASANFLGVMSGLINQAQFLFNDRTVLYFVAAGSFFVCAYSIRMYYQSLGLTTTSWAPTFAIIGGVLVAIWGPQEISDLARRATINTQTAGVLTTVYLAVYALVVLVGGIYARSASLRVGSIVLFVVVIFKTFFVDMWSLGGLYRISAMIFLGVVLLIVGYLHARYATKIKEFLIVKDASI